MSASVGKVLIFGASGHIGGAVARFMQYKGWRERLRLATSDAAKLHQLKSNFPDCEAVVADYLKLDSLDNALKGVRAVFVITPDFIDEQAAMSNLVKAVSRLPDFHQIVRILGDPPNMSLKKVPDIVRAFGRGTAIQHLQAKEVLDQSDLPVTYLNIASYLMDDLVRWSGPIKSDRTLAMPFDRRTAWIDPGDLGEAAARIIMSKCDLHIHQLYHLNNGNDYVLFSEIAEMVSDVLQIHVKYDDSVEFWERALGARYVELFGERADEYFREYYAFEQRYQAAFHRSDILERILGRKPKTLRAWIEQNGQFLV